MMPCESLPWKHSGVLNHLEPEERFVRLFFDYCEFGKDIRSGLSATCRAVISPYRSGTANELSTDHVRGSALGQCFDYFNHLKS